MVTPIVDTVVESLGTPALYPEPPLLVLYVDEQVHVLESVDKQVPVLVSSPIREVAGVRFWMTLCRTGCRLLAQDMSDHLPDLAVFADS